MLYKKLQFAKTYKGTQRICSDVGARPRWVTLLMCGSEGNAEMSEIVKEKITVHLRGVLK